MGVDIPELTNSLELGDRLVLSDVGLRHVFLVLLLLVFLLLDHGPDNVLVFEFGFLGNASRTLCFGSGLKVILDVILLVCFYHISIDSFVVSIRASIYQIINN